jgi:carbon storage regulator
VLTIGADASSATANLLRPIVIHERTRVAAQVVLDGDWPLRAPLQRLVRPASGPPRAFRPRGAPGGPILRRPWSPRKEHQMLVLTRRSQQSIMIGKDVVITVLEVRGDQVRIGVSAPREVEVHREEVFLELEQANKGGGVPGRGRAPGTRPAAPARCRPQGRSGSGWRVCPGRSPRPQRLSRELAARPVRRRGPARPLSAAADLLVPCPPPRTCSALSAEAQPRRTAARTRVVRHRPGPLRAAAGPPVDARQVAQAGGPAMPNPVPGPLSRRRTTAHSWLCLGLKDRHEAPIRNQPFALP